MNITHTFIGGLTQSGKTNLAMTFYLKPLKGLKNLRIFINTKHDYKVIKNSDLVFNKVPQLIELIERVSDPKTKRKNLKVCFNTSNKRHQAIIQMRQITALLLTVGRGINGRRLNTRYWVTVYIDEYHRFSSKRSEDETVDLIFTEGLGLGIIAYCITQRPAKVSHTALSECEVQYYYLFMDYEMSYFKRHGLDIPENRKHLGKPYHFIRVDRDGTHKLTPVMEVR